jgi:hypothetical protein
MKKTVGIILFCYLFSITACSQNQQNNRLLSPKEMSEDFEYLVKTLDEMNPDLYAFISKDDFDKKVSIIREEIKKPMTLLDFFLKVSYIVHSVKQGHTQASYMLDFWQVCNSGMIPLNFRVIDNQLFVKDNYSSTSDLVRGSEILSINGIPSAELIDTLGKYAIKETEKFSELALEGRFPYYLWMVFQFNDGYKLKYIPPYETQIKTATLEGLSIFAYGDWRIPKTKKREYDFKIDENNIGILKAESFSVELEPFKVFIDSVFHVIQNEKIDNLIIDIRDNDGGDIVHGYLILDYLTTKPMKFADKYYSKTSELTKELNNNPNRTELSPLRRKYWPFDDNNYNKELKYRSNGAIFETKLKKFIPDPDKYKFNGKVFVLTNGLVFSSALPFAYMVKDYNLATIVGEETGIVSPAYGEPLKYKLPNSRIQIMNSTSYIIRPSGVVNNRGVIPDYIVEPNVMDLITGFDKVMEYTKDLIMENNINSK